jgi:hypothetical protein
VSIDLVCGAIASLLDGLAVTSGSTAYALRASDPPPAKLDTAQLPAAWTFTGAAQDDWSAHAVGQVTRQYAVQVAVLPVGQSTPEQREQRTRPFIEAVRARLAAHPRLGGNVPWLERVRVTGDSGIILLPEYGGIYIGFELRLEALEAVRVTLSD